MRIRRIVIDVLIPHEPNVIEYAEKISGLESVDGVTVYVSEIDERTKTLEMAIEGEDIPFDQVIRTIEELGGSLHSVDEVSAGSRIVAHREMRWVGTGG